MEQNAKPTLTLREKHEQELRKLRLLYSAALLILGGLLIIMQFSKATPSLQSPISITPVANGTVRVMLKGENLLPHFQPQKISLLNEQGKKIADGTLIAQTTPLLDQELIELTVDLPVQAVSEIIPLVPKIKFVPQFSTFERSKEIHYELQF
jgi:hypothetical protein